MVRSSAVITAIEEGYAMLLSIIILYIDKDLHLYYFTRFMTWGKRIDNQYLFIYFFTREKKKIIHSNCTSII